MYEAEYRSKLMTPVAAVELIPARGTLSMGMAISEPPALLKALEGRVQRRGSGGIEELRVYYSHSVAAPAATILKYEYMEVIKPHPFFPTVVERMLFERGARRIGELFSICRATSVPCRRLWRPSGLTHSS